VAGCAFVEASLSFLRGVFLVPEVVGGALILDEVVAEVVVAEAPSNFSPPKFTTMVELSVCECEALFGCVDRGGERVDSSLDRGDNDEELKFAGPPESPGNWRGDVAAADMLQSSPPTKPPLCPSWNAVRSENQGEKCWCLADEKQIAKPLIDVSSKKKSETNTTGPSSGFGRR
jgi:hypothetical protein